MSTKATLNVFSLCDILEKRRKELLSFAAHKQSKQEHEELDCDGIKTRAEFQAQIDIAEQYAGELEDLSRFVQTVHYSLICSKFWSYVLCLPDATQKLKKVPIFDSGFPALINEIELFLYRALPYYCA